MRKYVPQEPSGGHDLEQCGERQRWPVYARWSRVLQPFGDAAGSHENHACHGQAEGENDVAPFDRALTQLSSHEMGEATEEYDQALQTEDPGGQRDPELGQDGLADDASRRDSLDHPVKIGRPADFLEVG